MLKTDDFGEKVLGYGGDFDERATDYEFSGDGIVFADRTPSPKAAEVKQLYANVKVKVTEEGVIIKNDNLFIDTSAYIFETIVKRGRKIIHLTFYHRQNKKKLLIGQTLKKSQENIFLK